MHRYLFYGSATGIFFMAQRPVSFLHLMHRYLFYGSVTGNVLLVSGRYLFYGSVTGNVLLLSGRYLFFWAQRPVSFLWISDLYRFYGSIAVIVFWNWGCFEFRNQWFSLIVTPKPSPLQNNSGKYQFDCDLLKLPVENPCIFCGSRFQ
jgi:hypothetical protein